METNYTSAQVTLKWAKGEAFGLTLQDQVGAWFHMLLHEGRNDFLYVKE